MADDDFTTIRVKKSTHKKICDRGSKGDNMDDIICRALARSEEKK